VGVGWSELRGDGLGLRVGGAGLGLSEIRN
jgi:hypothetical protein